MPLLPPAMDQPDHDLLNLARSLWVEGNWEALTALADAANNHANSAEISAYLATAFAQQGELESAKVYWQQSERNSEDQVCDSAWRYRLFLSGVHNSLARACVINDEVKKGQQHWQQAISLVFPGPEQRIFARSRRYVQLMQLGVPGWWLDEPAQDLRLFNSCRAIPQLQLKKKIELGNAWSGNTINTVIFRHHGIMTVGEYQYMAFYIDGKTMRLVRRNLADDSLQIQDITGNYNLQDAHNSISLGMDRKGYLHISYDHHATQLKYRRSVNPHDISAWTDELPMTGKNEERVTYPTFILPRQGFPLTLLYRHGTHNNGTAFLKTYDEARRQWQDHPKPILSGAEQKPWTANAYWNNPVVGNDGSLHLSFVWRTHALGEEKRVNNINVGYAKSYDNGLTWWTSNDQPYQLPITPTNAETIWPVSPGSNLINQCSMALDSQQQPHIVFYSNHPSTGVPTYQHLWLDGTEWQHQYIAQVSQPFNLLGGGTLQIPVSRPTILIDKNDNVHVIYRDRGHAKGFCVATLAAPDYQFCQDAVKLLTDDIGFAEPVIDRERWAENKELTLLQQFNDQPDHDEFYSSAIESQQSELVLSDYCLECWDK